MDIAQGHGGTGDAGHPGVPRSLLLVGLSACLAGCEYKLDVLGDWGGDGGACPRPMIGNQCPPPPFSFEVATRFSDELPDPLYPEETVPPPWAVAQGGIVELLVVRQGIDGSLSVDVAGGAEVDSQRDDVVSVRVDDEVATVRAEIGERDTEIDLESRPIDRVRLKSLGGPFRLVDPASFAMAEGGEADFVVVLEDAGRERRLVDASTAASGDAVLDQPSWDRVRIAAGEGRPVEVALAAESGARTVEIPTLPPIIDTIEVATGPGLSDPSQPIVLDDHGDATVCFFGLAGGVPLARPGLAHRQAIRRRPARRVRLYRHRLLHRPHHRVGGRPDRRVRYRHRFFLTRRFALSRLTGVEAGRVIEETITTRKVETAVMMNV